MFSKNIIKEKSRPMRNRQSIQQGLKKIWWKYMPMKEKLHLVIQVSKTYYSHVLCKYTWIVDMLCFAKSSTTVKQLATTQQNCLLLFSHKKLWSPADKRMVSQILATSYILIHKLFPYMGYYSTTVISSEAAHYSWQKEYTWYSFKSI